MNVLQDAAKFQPFHLDFESQLPGGQVQVAPYDWGSPIESLLQPNQTSFDIVVAADCIYMPQWHSLLLQSIRALLKLNVGVGLLPFALHGNTDDDKVWEMVPLAQSQGFVVDVLEPTQLTPQSTTMESKRALVHMIRLRLVSPSSNE